MEDPISQQPQAHKQEDDSSSIEEVNTPPTANELSLEPLSPPQSTIPTSTSLNSTSKPSENPHAKPCDLCKTPRDVLIRCEIDETKKWHFICTGKCWKSVSGGRVDGTREHQHYRYGGMWRNKHEVASAKIKGKAKEDNSLGPYFKSKMHRRSGHAARNTKGKNKTGKVVVYCEGEDDDDENDDEDAREDADGKNAGSGHFETESRSTC